LALVLSGPLLFFAGLEATLFLTGKFEPVPVLKQVEHEGKNYWVMEPEYTRRVLGRDNVILRQKFFAPVEREPGTRRVVLLGESAAAGYPLPEYGLGRIMKVLWGAEFPGEKLEMIDMTSVGVNSHVLRVFVREAMRMQPDAVILYAGHNEIIGPYGPANVFGYQAPGAWFAQAGLTLGNTRVGRALSLLAAKTLGEGTAEWRGLEEFRAAHFAADDPAVGKAADLAEANFRSIVETALDGGAKMLICVPAVNLADWPPLVSADGPVDKSARAAYDKARGLELASQTAEAWRLYRSACDLDQMRFRADSRVREGQREVVIEMASPDVLLVDADIRLHEENPGPLTDRDLFLEHVHLTFEGRVAVAALMVDGLAELLGVSPAQPSSAQDWWAAFPSRLAEARTRTMFTEAEEAVMWEQVASLLQLDVFSTGQDIGERRERAAQRVVQLRTAATKFRDSTVVQEAYLRALAGNPDDAELHDTAFKHFGPAGDRPRARDALKRAVELQPNLVLASLALAELAMEEGRMADAQRMVHAADNFQTGGTELDVISASLLAGRGEYAKAAELLHRYVARWPNDARAIGMLASLHARMSNAPEAVRFYREALRHRPESAADLNNFAWFLATKPDATATERAEALFMARRVVESDPTSHRFRGTLAAALLAEGHDEQAKAEGQRAISMAREAGDLESIDELRTRLGQGATAP
jgi:Tfp pilus assembly protein PilF/lysophospholipase L1-like esterase